MDEREQKGLMIAATSNIVKRGNETWIVPSQTAKGSKYAVTIAAEGKACTCPDFELRQKPCKHIIAVQLVLFRETTTETKPDGSVVTTTTEAKQVRVTYGQDWTNYNRSQTLEKELFCGLLHDLCAAVPEPVQVMGRPRIPMSDALFSACFKVYSTASSRRFSTDLREAQTAGYVERPWHFNTVLKVIEDKEITPTLHKLVAATAAPLKSIESAFAVDSTGFGTQQYYRHVAAKYGREKFTQDWLKLHVLVGVKTHTIASCVITDRDGSDSPQFKPLVQDAATIFDMKEITADKAYSGYDNLELVESIGATPYVPFKVNAVAVARSKRRKPSKTWARLFHFFQLNRDEFLAHYHQRSNVESVFSSMKRVFGDTLRSKTIEAQTNELLLKVIAHNIVRLIHAIFEHGITVPGLATCTQSRIDEYKVTA